MTPPDSSTILYTPAKAPEPSIGTAEATVSFASVIPAVSAAFWYWAAVMRVMLSGVAISTVIPARFLASAF